MALIFLTAFGQLVDTYIRWLPFSQQASSDLKLKIFTYSALWGVASIFLYKLIFDNFGVNGATYKAILMLGWAPYFFIVLKKMDNMEQIKFKNLFFQKIL